MGDKIIVVREAPKRGCFSRAGCLVFSLIFGYLIYSAITEFNETNERLAAKEKAEEKRLASLTPEERAKEMEAKRLAELFTPPSSDVVELQMNRAMRKYLHDPDSYKPAASTTTMPIADGWLYLHEYRAKNAFGAYIKSTFALTCTTNTGKQVWTTYTNDQAEILLKNLPKL